MRVMDNFVQGMVFGKRIEIAIALCMSNAMQFVEIQQGGLASTLEFATFEPCEHKARLHCLWDSPARMEAPQHRVPMQGVRFSWVDECLAPVSSQRVTMEQLMPFAFETERHFFAHWQIYRFKPVLGAFMPYSIESELTLHT